MCQQRIPLEGNSWTSTSIKQHLECLSPTPTMASLHLCEYSGMAWLHLCECSGCPLCCCLLCRLLSRGAAAALHVSSGAARSGLPTDGTGLGPVCVTCRGAPAHHHRNVVQGREHRSVGGPCAELNALSCWVYRRSCSVE